MVAYIKKSQKRGKSGDFLPLVNKSRWRTKRKKVETGRIFGNANFWRKFGKIFNKLKEVKIFDEAWKRSAEKNFGNSRKNRGADHRRFKIH